MAKLKRTINIILEDEEIDIFQDMIVSYFVDSETSKRAYLKEYLLERLNQKTPYQ